MCRSGLLRRDTAGCVDLFKTGRSKAVNMTTACFLSVPQDGGSCIITACTQARVDGYALEYITLRVAATDGLHQWAGCRQVGKCGVVASFGEGIEARKRRFTRRFDTRRHLARFGGVTGKARRHGIACRTT